MTALLLLGWVPPVLASYVLIDRFAPARTHAARGLNLALGAGFGLGLSACFAYLWLAAGGQISSTLILVESALFIGLAAALAVLPRPNSPPLLAVEPPPKLLRFVLGLAVIGFLVAASVNASGMPHGKWDAFAIWNLRARFLFRGGSQWTNTFAPDMAWTHADYPLLLPAIVARSWRLFGDDSPRIPAAVSILFACGVVAVLVTTVTVMRDATLGSLAGLAILAADHFVRHAADQYSDLPLAFYMLACVALLCIAFAAPERNRGCFMLAGLAAGLAAWTKNEGLLFVVVVSGVLLVRTIRRNRARAGAARLLCFAAGLLPIIAVLVHFKWSYAPANDLVSATGWAELRARLSDPVRLAEAARLFGPRVVAYASGLPLVLVACGALLGIRADGRAAQALFPAAVATLMLAAYYVAYVVTPHEIAWHVSTSANRLILQVSPIGILALFLVVRSPGERAAPAPLASSAVMSS